MREASRTGICSNATLSVGSLLVVAGAVIALSTWPRAQSDALGDTWYPTPVTSDIGLVLGLSGFVIVIVVWIARGLSRYESVNQDSKP